MVVVACSACGTQGPESHQGEPRTVDLRLDEPPSVPALFAPGVVSTGLAERDLTITPDGNELYFSAQVGANAHFSAILVLRRNGDHWTGPEVAPFSGQHFDLEPAISPDGKQLFFVSNRPKPGADQPTTDEDIWVVEREGDGWGAPRNIGPPINSDRPEFFPSLTRDGTLYFTARDEEGEAIFRARPSGDGYTEPVRLGPQVNTGRARFNAFVAPDESFLILPIYGREDSLGGVDYYVVFRSDDDRWSDPIPLGPQINWPSGNEWSASLSPDGKALFFMASRSEIENRRAPDRLGYAEMQRLHEQPMNGNSDIWWVDAGIVSALRPEKF